MTTDLYAIEKLTQPWTDVLSPKETGTGRYIPIDYPPLLDLLDDACHANIGERGSGRSAPASRMLLDVEAHSLREHIDGTVRAWIGQLSRQRAEAGLKDAVLQLAGILKAHHAAGTIPDSEHTRILAFFPRWCDRIWRLYDPPKEVPLDGPCSNADCEQTHTLNSHGEVQSALVAFYHRGSGVVQAKCRACGWSWGPDTVALLGRHLGATQDENVIRAAGL